MTVLLEDNLIYKIVITYDYAKQTWFADLYDEEDYAYGREAQTLAELLGNIQDELIETGGAP